VIKTSVILGFGIFCLGAGTVTGGDLRIGTAAVKITPPVGMPMAGYYYNRAAEGVHDDLYAKAIVLSLDGSKVVMIACDMVGLPGTIIEDRAGPDRPFHGIATDRIMISATHAHTGPLLTGKEPPHRTRRRDGPDRREYAARLPELIVESARQADVRLKPAILSAGKGVEPSLTFHRRYHMTDGYRRLEPRQAQSENRQACGSYRSGRGGGLCRDSG
jgi:hypothetical protein